MMARFQLSAKCSGAQGITGMCESMVNKVPYIIAYYICIGYQTWRKRNGVPDAENKNVLIMIKRLESNTRKMNESPQSLTRVGTRVRTVYFNKKFVATHHDIVPLLLNRNSISSSYTWDLSWHWYGSCFFACQRTMFNVQKYNSRCSCFHSIQP
jgi:hypothetical protein